MDQPTQQPTPNPIPPQAPIKAQPQNLLSPDRLYQPHLQQLQSKQNLIKPPSVSTSTRPAGFWKSIVLDILSVVFAGLFGWTSFHYLNGTVSFWFVLGALLLWGSMSVLEGFLQTSTSRRFLILLLELIGLIAFFYSYPWQALAITVIVVLVFLFIGYISVRRELNNTLEIRFFAASGKVLGKVITAAIIFMIVMYAAPAGVNGNFFISQNSFNVFFSWSAGLVNNFYPSVPLGGSFGDFAQAIAQKQLQSNPEFQGLTTAQQSQATADSADQLMGTFNATPTEPTSEVFYNYFAGMFANLQNHFGAPFIGIWALALFLILRSIGIIVVWAGEFIALLFYEFLLATGFMKVTEQVGTKEKIGY